MLDNDANASTMVNARARARFRDCGMTPDDGMLVQMYNCLSIQIVRSRRAENTPDPCNFQRMLQYGTNAITCSVFGFVHVFDQCSQMEGEYGISKWGYSQQTKRFSI